ncbi:MAG: hypothetical protein HW409_692 [candidate division NC10 bacterium]|nr:hypothetical protein [candidate division NC10 bacterium]
MNRLSEVKPMNKVAKVEALDNYRLFIEFSDGVKGTVNLADRLFGAVFQPLKDGAVCWPNGADLAPDRLYKQLAEKE